MTLPGKARRIAAADFAWEKTSEQLYLQTQMQRLSSESETQYTASAGIVGMRSAVSLGARLGFGFSAERLLDRCRHGGCDGGGIAVATRELHA